jgi:GMP synthase-like glutamine amidotransferase
VNVISVIHGGEARTELFAPVVEDAGHGLDEWSFVWGSPPPRPLESYDAVMVFGGAMHADQEALHPWINDELRWLEALLERRTPVLGICLGVQLLARAAGSWVGPLPEPEIGWYGVELTDEGAADPVLGALPRSFEALQWHRYTYDLPAEAVELATSPAATQAFRLGDACWGVQFHPEVTRAQVEGWLLDPDDPPLDAEALRAEIPGKIGRWNELGRTLCRAFLEEAEQRLSRAA